MEHKQLASIKERIEEITGCKAAVFTRIGPTRAIKSKFLFDGDTCFSKGQRLQLVCVCVCVCVCERDRSENVIATV